ncbi:hypothetical protein GCM10023221_17860 [Luteimicrobium xylanilyticum]|uniref:Uncharacterized protein n=1 Tax=Luteimicrobium xylanilyticum TaxID=1133546 RepID=A0A5P9Q9I4_9MICO|nr:hypothetical protein [Luteimicrobium xylanilyticum]QFU97722.1 hypothetical protein KDY119_01221 [Luteimicrobium xylanilyticum]
MLRALVELFARHWQGLSNLQNHSGGAPRWVTRAVLYGAPVMAAGVAIWQSWGVRSVADTLIAAFSLLTGVLIAVFAQIAGWRTRLDDRASDRPVSEAPARRAVDATAAHALVGVVACCLATGTSVLAKVEIPPERVWSGLSVGLALYVALLILLIVGTVFGAYQDNVDPAVREADDDLQRPESRELRIAA